MSPSRHRQANITTEEAGEIAKLVRKRYKSDKKIWGKRFWRKLEGTGMISKSRTAETLRNFVRNVSTGKANFKWDSLFPGIPKQGESSKTFSFWVSQRKSILETWEKEDLVRAVELILSEKLSDFDDSSLWKRFVLKHNFVKYTPEDFQNLFENLDTSLLIEVGVPEIQVRQLKKAFLESDRPVRDNFEDNDTIEDCKTSPKPQSRKNGNSKRVQQDLYISKKVSDNWDYIFNANRQHSEIVYKSTRRTEKSMNACARLYQKLTKANTVGLEAGGIKPVLISAAKQVNNNDRPDLKDLALIIINTLKISRTAVEEQEGNQ